MSQKTGYNVRVDKDLWNDNRLPKLDVSGVRHQGNRTLAAKTLGINISTLYRKIRALRIEVPETDGRTKRP